MEGKWKEIGGFRSFTHRFVSRLVASDKTRDENIKKRHSHNRPYSDREHNFSPGHLQRKRKTAMDSAAQADGEKRVRRLLIEPLERRGLGRPTTLTRKAYNTMVDDLCARLAYMSKDGLMALEDQAAAHPSGPKKDRMPIANHILEWAGQIEPPSDSVSPLVRAVFGAPIGQQSIVEGYAPELLAEVKKFRKWPTPFAIKLVRERAQDAVRQMQRTSEMVANNQPLKPELKAWRDHRLAAIARCEDIASMASRSGAAQ